MFKFSKTTLINSLNYLDSLPAWFTTEEGTISLPEGYTKPSPFGADTTGTDETSLTVSMKNKFFPKSVLKITKAEPVDGVEATATIDFDGFDLEQKVIYRLFVYIRSVGNADPLYANDFVYKGRPLFIEFKAGSNATATAEALEKAANKWITLIYGNGNIINVKKDETGKKVILTASNYYQTFHIVKLQTIDDTQENMLFAHDGEYVDVDPKTGSEETAIVIENNVLPFGTYDQIIKDLRLPTNANLRLYRDKVDEVPMVGATYNQYVITTCTERPEMQGTSVLGQYNKSITTHCFFVNTAIADKFETALEILGADSESTTKAFKGTEEGNVDVKTVVLYDVNAESSETPAEP